MTNDGSGNNRKYFLYNGHGDVIQLTNSTGDVIKTYDYDAFGNEKNIDANDTNVFRYCGEYFDKETGTIYLRARYYDPSLGRFITQDTYLGKANDPSSLNYYTYCGNNPVNAWDPSGHIIKVSGNESNQNVILGYLQKLTNNELVIVDGEVGIAKYNSDTKNPKIFGDILLYRMIVSKKTCTVKIGGADSGNSFRYSSAKKASNGKGSDGTVYFNPTSNNPLIETLDPQTGTVSPSNRPHEIGLGHELIHADRAMRGVTIPLNKTTSQTYTDAIGNKVTEIGVRCEELATVGISGNTNNDITENDLREEQGQNPRGAY